MPYKTLCAFLPLQRVNGRVAMWGWANLLGPELAKHTPVGDQFGDAWVGAGNMSCIPTMLFQLYWIA